MLNRSIFWLSICLVSLFGCESAVPTPTSIVGLRPIYVDPAAAQIQSEPPREFGLLGKIEYVDPFIFINEQLQGIHVIDNTNPNNPEQIAFWAIPGNIDFTISGDILYADNSWDLLTIDITDIHQIELLSTVENFYQRPQTDQLYPKEYDGFFECVDTSKGIVVGWEESLLVDPKCWAEF